MLLRAVAIEHITRYLAREWLLNQKVVVYHVKDLTQYTLAAWKNAVEGDLNHWNIQHPWLALFDLSEVNDVLTVHGRLLMDGICVKMTQSNLLGNLAVNLPDGEIGNALRLYLSRSMRYHQTTINGALFRSRDEAIQWLLNNPIPKPSETAES